MFIPDPRSRIRFLPIPDPGSWISDPGSKNSNERQGEKIVVITFFGAINYKKLNYFIFLMLKKKIWPNFKEL
jgi:hypothetical protein